MQGTLKVLSVDADGAACCAPAGVDETRALALAQLTLRLHRALGLLERDQVCCRDVTIQQCYTLALLRRQDAKTMQQMADALGLAVSTVTRNVDVLERRGEVQRERDPKDARIVHVGLTADGERLADDLIAGETACCASLLQFVPPERRDTLITALSDLLRASEQLHNGGACCG
jgi:DNA-binding MarR family transcriptional regulator